MTPMQTDDCVSGYRKAINAQQSIIRGLRDQLTDHKAALNLCQMALNADRFDTFMELKFEALSKIAKLTLST